MGFFTFAFLGLFLSLFSLEKTLNEKSIIWSMFVEFGDLSLNGSSKI